MDNVALELFDELSVLWEEIKADHQKAFAKGNKSAARRARTNLGILKKKISPYRQASSDAFKQD